MLVAPFPQHWLRIQAGERPIHSSWLCSFVPGNTDFLPDISARLMSRQAVLPS
jgi:hypothetical protein